MNPHKSLKTALVCALLAMSSLAHAGAYKGLVERRAVNDKSVTVRKQINVEFKNSKTTPGVKIKALGGKAAKKGAKGAENRPVKAGQVRAVKIVKLSKTASSKKAGGGK